MVEEHKGYNLIRYCVGMSLDGPIYTTHFVSTRKPKPNYPKCAKQPTVMGWKTANKCFKHEHNN